MAVHVEAVKSPSSLPFPGAVTQVKLVQVGSSQSISPSPLLSRPSRQSLSATRTQSGAVQVKLVWQSAGCAHEVRQALLPQAKPLAQLPPVPALQPPAASQCPSQAEPQITVVGG